ncbi:MAG: hypothetical protein AAGI03_10835 [Pseudomonadota bacterium]
MADESEAPQVVSAAVEQLFASQIVLILALETTAMPDVVSDVRQSVAEQHEMDVIHLSLPMVDGEDEEAEFFQNLGTQAGLEGEITRASQLVNGIRKRLSEEKVLLLVTRFEHAPSSLRQSLANAIRAIAEEHSEFHAILCGGRKLLELKYADGDLSMLSSAWDLLWPEPSADALAEELDVPAAARDAVISMSGGHRAIMNELAFAARQSGVDDLTGALHRSPTVWQPIVSRARDEAMRDRLCALVETEDHGPQGAYQPDQVLRELFWKGLVTAHQDGVRRVLKWRTDAIQDAARSAIERVIQCS